MNKKINDFVEKIIKERQEQSDTITSSYDLKKRPNDWVALLCRYIVDCGEFNSIKPTAAEFERTLIIISAICLAAYEAIDNMIQKDYLNSSNIIDEETDDIVDIIDENQDIMKSIQQIHEEVDDNSSKKDT